MIKGLHVTIFTPDAAALRAFFRDQVGLPGYDAGGGWLIFNLPEAEIGCHDVAEMERAQSPGEHGVVLSELSFYCDDIQATVDQLTERGVSFSSDITDRGYALSARFVAPGGEEFEVYQPTYRS